MISKINILAILCLLVALLMGCTTPHINQVKDKWGPPANVEDRGDTIVYYYYFYKGKVSGLTTTITSVGAMAGWVVVEIITDREGKILKKRKYWKQPEIK